MRPSRAPESVIPALTCESVIVNVTEFPDTMTVYASPASRLPEKPSVTVSTWATPPAVAAAEAAASAAD